jgi:hypothetical protein
VYAEALTRLERDYPVIASQASDWEVLDARSKLLRSRRTSESDPDRIAGLEGELNSIFQTMARLTFDLRRRLRRVESERERALAARHELGVEAEHYPGIPRQARFGGGDADRADRSQPLPLFDGVGQPEGDEP